MININVLKNTLKELNELEIKVLFYITSLCENKDLCAYIDWNNTLLDDLCQDILGEKTVDNLLDVLKVLDYLKNHNLIETTFLCTSKTNKNVGRNVYYPKLYEPKKRTEKEKQEKIAEMKFIFSYLNPKSNWNEGVSLSTQLNELQEKVNYKALEYASRMNYNDFLKTPYWKTITAKVKQMHNYTCQLCGKTGVPLHTHHPSNYNFRGFELYHLGELMCLCSECHAKFHNKN